MPKRILLVEDQSLIAMVEKKQLEMNDYLVDIASNGEEAVRLAGTGYDLILMDIDLGPGISGIEAARQILESHGIPLVFLSAHAEKEIVDETEKVSSYGYILKNAGITVLIASIRMALKLHETRIRLEAREKGYRELFLANPHPMWVYDLENLRVLEVNDAALAVYGYRKDEFLAMRITQFRPPEDVEKLLGNVARVSEGLDQAGLWRHVTKTGQVLRVRIVSHTLEWQGHKAEMVLSMVEAEESPAP